MTLEEQVRAAIKTIYGTEAGFARECGWSRQRMNRIMARKRLPSLKEIPMLSEKLGLPLETMIYFFME